MQIYKYSFLSIIVAYNSHYYPLLTFAWRPCNLCDHLSWFDLKQRHISYLNFNPNSSFYLKVGMSRNLYSQSAAVCPLTISIILNQMCYFVALYIKLPYHCGAFIAVRRKNVDFISWHLKQRCRFLSVIFQVLF